MTLESVLQIGYSLIDKGLIPDFILRPVIRALCRQRLREINLGSFEANHAAKLKWIEQVRARDAVAIADLPEKANEQHYEVCPPEIPIPGCVFLKDRHEGFYQLYFVVLRSLRQVFAVFIPNWQRDFRGSRNPDARQLLRESAIGRWTRHTRPWMWYFPTSRSPLLVEVLNI